VPRLASVYLGNDGPGIHNERHYSWPITRLYSSSASHRSYGSPPLFAIPRL
jgi:hypothetical protein